MVRGVALAVRGVVAGVQGGRGVRSCAVTLSDAQNGRRAARGGRASEMVRRTPQDAPQATTGGTGCGASTRRTPCPQRAHRCPTEREAGRGAQLPTHSTKKSHSRPG